MIKKIYLGAAYYPELWDESELEKDIARCKEIGVNCLRIGEFAWSKMEPKEGEFRFDWFLRIVDRLYENGIDTLLCTPTCTPPRWMLNRYPEMRRVMQDGLRCDVSSRAHVCKTSKIAREKNARIVTEMAKAFAGHKGIIGWQIDNEIFPDDEGCFCKNCKHAFRAYLKEKYGTTEKVNKAWGMYRWSLDYGSFEEIEPPYPKQWRHPSLRKEWWDFQCLQIKTYEEEQAEILHRFGFENVGTDMTPQNCMSYYALNEKLDTVQFNHYDRAERLYSNGFSYDFLRCVKDKSFWVTETQVGWNGGKCAESGYRPVGNCYANTWLPIAKGAQMNLYWLFRTHPNGHELGHGALYSTAGRKYRVTEEVQKAAADLRKCERFLTESKIESKIALHYSHTAFNDFGSAPLVERFDYRERLIGIHAALRHYNVDVIDTPHTLGGYEVLISPFLATVDENGLKERVVEWVKNGGTWIVGPMSDIMNANVSKYTRAPYSFLEEFAGVYTKYQKPVDNDVFKAKWQDGSECKIGLCFDAYECNEGTTPLVSYDGDEFNELAAVAERKVGKGKVILLGTQISNEDLLRLISCAPIAEASNNVALVKRSGGESGIIAVELENRRGEMKLDGRYTELITGRTLSGNIELSPYGVLVLKKQ